MTRRDMEVFLAVVEKGTMRAAANSLYISVPSVSEVIRQMEAECGGELFDRLNHKLYITPFGKAIYEYAVRIHNLHLEMEKLMETEPRLLAPRIGATITVGDSVLLPILKDAGLINAQVYVNNTLHIEKMLLRSELDIALVEGSIHNDALHVEPVLPDELVLACSPEHPFARCPVVSWKQLRSCPLLLREEGSGTRVKLLSAYEERKIAPVILWESSSVDALLSAARQGVGVTIISARLVPEDMSVSHIEGFNGNRYFSLVWHKDKRMNEALRRFITCCQKWESGDTLSPENETRHA